jgi:hypothetical protein
MRRFRFTIASLLGVVLVVAVAFAALREATALWDSIVFTLTACLLLASVLLAVHRAGEARAYWSGFALFGAAYLVASLIPPVESRLVTSGGLAYLDSKIPGRNRPMLFARSGGKSYILNTTYDTPQGFAVATVGGTPASPSQGSIQFWDVSTGKLLAGPNGTTEHFVRIGHSFVALIAALAGGRLSRWLHAAGRRRAEGAAPTGGREG